MREQKTNKKASTFLKVDSLQNKYLTKGASALCCNKRFILYHTESKDHIKGIYFNNYPHHIYY